MARDALRERIAHVVAAVLGDPQGDGEWDSLQLIEVVLAVEDEFGVTFAEAEIPSMRSVDDVASRLERLHAAR